MNTKFVANSTSLKAGDAQTKRVEVVQGANNAVSGCNAGQGKLCDDATDIDRQNHIGTVITSNQCIAANTSDGDGVG